MAHSPLIMTPVPQVAIQAGDGEHCAQFIEGFCRHTKDGIASKAGDLIELRAFQRNITGCVYARRPDGRYRHREALIGLPRKNGKSELGSSYGLYGLVMGGQGSEIYSCAADKDQARIVFNVAKKMVELDEFLSAEIKVYRDALEHIDSGSVYKVLSSEAFSKEGLNPTVVVYDELHAAPNDELYNVMTMGSGTRASPLFIAITTAGVMTDQTGQDSICYRRYQAGEKIASGEDIDETMFMVWFGAPKGADHRDPATWEAANPGYGDFLDPEDFASVLKKVHENDFRTKRMNQWVGSAKAWLPFGAWDGCRSDREFVPGKLGVVLGFDGSRSQDCTALVAVTVDADPMVKVINLWEKPRDAAQWKVPRGEVKDAIRQACRDYTVREIAWDEWIWNDAADELTDEGLPVVIFPQNNVRMAPATQRFYEAVTTHHLEHDGDPRLSRHIGNAQTKTDNRGTRLVKDAPNSPRKIDLAVAAVMAFDRAAFWLHEPGPDTWLGKPIEEIGFVW